MVDASRREFASSKLNGGEAPKAWRTRASTGHKDLPRYGPITATVKPGIGIRPRRDRRGS